MIRWDYLPKVGSNGLAIHLRYRNYADWEMTIWVARYMQKHGISSCWFQCFDNTNWVWSHGIVELQNGRAIITQIG